MLYDEKIICFNLGTNDFLATNPTLLSRRIAVDSVV
jgi:hypothetical protein